MIKKKKKKITSGFNIGEMVVYPSHGVGQINTIENLTFDKVKIKFLSIQMEQDNLVLKVPLLKGKAKVRRMMWSRRAQEYTNKINSGSPIMIGEVVRDLYRKNNQPEQSYSERQMFQLAVERLARELASVEKIDHFSATEKIESILKNK